MKRLVLFTVAGWGLLFVTTGYGQAHETEDVKAAIQTFEISGPLTESDYVGGFVIECEVTLEYSARNCALLSMPDGEPELMGNGMMDGFSESWTGRFYEDAPRPDQRHKFTFCDGSSITDKLKAQGMVCIGLISNFKRLARPTPSKFEINHELIKRASANERPKVATWDGEQPVITYPGSNEMKEYYPRRAFNDRKNGGVIMDCHWDDNGQFDDCRIQSEYPLGYGFGAVTKMMFEEKATVVFDAAMPDDARWKRFTYNWLVE